MKFPEPVPYLGPHAEIFGCKKESKILALVVKLLLGFVWNE
jgi:hypothetical protein